MIVLLRNEHLVDMRRNREESDAEATVKRDDRIGQAPSAEEMAHMPRLAE